ncbi:hypothetical protein D9611_012277 [Ephemerocybe angulata]|uniref:Ubiquinol-cytochrome C reductase hinge domain-containing protein n=1 Tax=Ephemerocybe angulata TaxID=980116 RepID=A0A8H5ATA0_9AGAR|nr:hypothetical protein D9611_012277 [Tulosesus angulatus]
MSSIVSFLSSFVSTVHNDAAEEKPEEQKEEQKEEPEQKEEEEEEEPEDVHPAIRESCKTTRCAKLAEHFEHCQEKVQSGKGFPHEDCVEELCKLCSAILCMSMDPG